MKFAATSKTLPDIDEWLKALATVTGFTDANPDSVVLGEDGTYTVNITMHINAEALNHKFDPVDPDNAEESTEED